MALKANGRHGGVAIRLIGLLVSVAAVSLVIHSVDLGSCANVLSHANPIPILVCLAILAAQVTLRSFRWRLLLPRKPGGGLVGVGRIAPVLLVGYLGNAVLPARLGEPIRAYLVARRERLDPVEAFGSVVLERVVDTATLAVVACAAAVTVNAPTWIVQATALAAIGGLAVTAALVVVGPGRLLVLTRRIAARFGIAARAEPILRRLDDFARGIDRPSRSGAVVVAGVVSAACWMLDATVFWMVAQSVGAPLSPAAALLVGAVTVLGTALPSAPGYVGTFELAAATTAQALGVAAAPALALAVLAHAVTVLPIAVAGAASLIAMDVRLGRLATDASSERAFGKAAPPL